MGNKSYSKGISWIDDCRIPFVDEIILLKGYEGDKWNTGDGKKNRVIDKQNNQGRFPANILVSDDMLNDGVISKSQGGNVGVLNNKVYGKFKGTKNNNGSGFGDKGTNSRYYDIDKWFNNLIDV